MIFVTVGTHEQSFNRLIQKVDELKRDGVIKDDVLIQIGFSTYEPKYCRWQKLFPFNEMKENIRDARIVITHGGPSSFIMPLQEGKTPIVVPRMAKYHEHVNDHQLDFALAVNERYKNLIVVKKVDDLGEIISNYDNLVKNMSASTLNNNAMFNKKFERIVDNLLNDNGH
ncbi:glycosyltransferase [Ligilactobacillus agilis]|uniref:glycosyltransferase n=1 Tax=Ligilactobacillus agilis TaxID=1601 RepID=UPI00143791DE|nr:glycosyltransferase [Ligilactobacillus agilis]GET15720.1 glycosyltransferase family 28 [Ligilactobacillus agilis]